MRRGASLLLAVLVLLSVVSAGCIGGGNFVYSKGKTISPGETREWPFKGPVNLTIKISSSAPVSVKIVGADGSIFRDFGKTRDVDITVDLPKGRWKVVVENPGDEKAVLDIEIRGR
ncbi:hypothetical protein A3L11_02705 [Thermococcus siculi]|uniref:Uncharacterized protein n=1 Tax=Thermococcus siculi TaxID=72803 RepID=A0A2Z2MVI2_9EURY|nr:hypothetical protein [Thermococcus siculi]ASJ08193.1 hypothetical protein A3L11_02705 [Thermococcus siculi]